MNLNTHKPTFKASITSLIEKCIAGLAPLILVPLYVKYLTIEEYGIWLMILSITSFLYLTNFGIAQVVTNAVAKDISADRVDYYNKVASSGFFLLLKITSIVLVILILLYLLIDNVFSEMSESMRIPLAITILSILITFPFQVYRNVLRGLNLIHLEQISLIIFGNLIRYIGIIFSLLSGFKLVALALIFSITSFLPSFGAGVFLKKIIPKFSISRQYIDLEYTKSMIKPGSHFFILMVSSSFLFGINTLVIGSVMGPSFVPPYAIPMQIMVLIMSTIGLASTNKMPIITGLFKAKEFYKLRGLYNDLIFFSFLIAFIAIINLIFFGETIIVIWAGPSIFYGNDLLYLMLVFLLASALRWPSDSFLYASENHIEYTYITIVEGILNVSLTIILTYLYGIKGTIIGTLIAYSLTNGWFLFYKTLKVIDYHFLDFFKWFLKNIASFLILIIALIYFLSYTQLLASYPLYLQIILLNIVMIVILVLVSRKNIVKVYNNIINN